MKLALAPGKPPASGEASRGRSSLALAALLALCSAIQSGAATAATVTLYTDFQKPAPQAVVEALREEVDSIMSPMGLRFEWWPLADFRSQTVSTAVVVAHFEARCDVNSLVMRENRNQPGSLV